VLVGLFVLATLAVKGPINGCEPVGSGPTATQWLERAEAAVGLPRIAGKVLAFQANDISILTNQSDRMYPPFIHTSNDTEWWFEPATGAERGGPAGRAAKSGFLHTGKATWQVRDTTLIPIPAAHAFLKAGRDLNPLAMLVDWRAAPGLRVEGRCIYREYPRTVLTRADGSRLFLDTKSAIPVKLERTEPHYLWGQVKVEYVYATWWAAGPVILPVATTRLVDGQEEVTRALTLGPSTARVTDSAPFMRVPSDAPDMSTAEQPMLTLGKLDTMRLGANAFLMLNRAYRGGLLLARDTVWVLDATQGEDRARADSAWIAKLFPGKHAVAVVVTDLAWPHISGVRFWVARGATIVTHPMSREFLQRVVDRRWTLKPDALEQTKPRATIRFRFVSDSLVAGGGAIRLYPIDGVGSEGALMAWLPDTKFLWAGDYLQDNTEPTQYATEVWTATRRAGIMPERVAAQHLDLTPWKTIADLGARLAPGAKP